VVVTVRRSKEGEGEKEVMVAVQRSEEGEL
jgi:hypothetical protein